MNTTEGCCGHEYTLYYGPPGVALFFVELATASAGAGDEGRQHHPPPQCHSQPTGTGNDAAAAPPRRPAAVDTGSAAAMAVAAGDRIVATLPAALTAFGNNTALYYGAAGLGFALRQLAMFCFGAGRAATYLTAAHAVEDHIAQMASPTAVRACGPLHLLCAARLHGPPDADGRAAAPPRPAAGRRTHLVEQHRHRARRCRDSAVPAVRRRGRG